MTPTEADREKARAAIVAEEESHEGNSEACGTCRFWLKRSDNAKDVGGGFCRRYPPSFPSGVLVFENPNRKRSIEHLYETQNSDLFLNDSWPSVHRASWCGEWSGTEPPSYASAEQAQDDGGPIQPKERTE